MLFVRLSCAVLATLALIIGVIPTTPEASQTATGDETLLAQRSVPESIPGKELLELFAEKSGNVAVVVDEYGGTAGIVTIEDVIEEIFGEIEDEHDRDDWVEESVGEGEYLFSARIDIDYLIEEYELEFEEHEEYETLGGLIIHRLESIPNAGTQIAVNDMSVIIEEVSDHRIDLPMRQSPFKTLA